jgi:DNA-binding NtrC family response regulator
MEQTLSSRQGPIPARHVGGATVLLVSEDPDEVETYRIALTYLGHKVRTCRSYSDGIRCLDFGGFDLVVVSQGSPKFEGRCVLERATEIDCSMPVLVVARCLDMHCYLEAIQLGAVDYLPEPFLASELGRLVANHCRFHSVA